MINFLKTFFGVIGSFSVVVWALLYPLLTLLSIKKTRIKYHAFTDVIILITMIIFMTGTQIILGNRELETVLKNLLPIVILLLTILSPGPTSKNITVVFYLIASLLVIDIIINVVALFFSVDLFGRQMPGLRPGDWTLRVKGVFGHPFASANLSISCLIFAIAKGSRLIVLFSALNLVLNGSFRAPLALSLLICIFLALRMTPYKIILLLFIPIYLVLVMYVTLLTVGTDDFITGNALRIVAWTNAYENLLVSPFWGVHHFAPLSEKDLHADNIVLTGNAEGNLLQLWLDYGLVPILCLLIFLFRQMSKSIYTYRLRKSNLNFASALFSTFVVYDLSFGSFYGTPLMILLMWALRTK